VAGCRVDRGNTLGRTLRTHRRRRLDSHDVAVLRLVGASTRTNVQDRAGRSERGVYGVSDPWIAAALNGVAVTVSLVVNVPSRRPPHTSMLYSLSSRAGTGNLIVRV
jgi:hypothetical protein